MGQVALTLENRRLYSAQQFLKFLEWKVKTMKYELFIAWRYLLAKRKVGFISLITFISIGGVAIGVMSLIVVISVMNGFDKDLREKILGTKSHLVLEQHSGMADYRELIEKVREDANVAAAAPVILGQGMLKSRSVAFGVAVKGVDPELEDTVTSLRDNIPIGSLDVLIDEMREADDKLQQSVSIFSVTPTFGGIILGKEVAKNLFNVSSFKDKEFERQMLRNYLGRKVKFTSPVEQDTPAGRVPRVETLQVVGIFESGLYDYDATLVFMSLPTTQRLYDRHDTVPRVEMRLQDLNAVEETAERLNSLLLQEFNRNYYFTTWKEMNQVFFRALQIEKLAMFIILVLIILVAAFNIASTLIMVVMEKTKDIGILLSMGARRRSIMSIFLLEGAAVGLDGVLIGSLVGVGVCEFLEVYKIDMPGGGGIYYIDTLPVQMLLSDFSLIVITALGVCLLGSLYPAWRASRLVPTEALRYE